MRFLELMSAVAGRGVEVVEVRAGSGGGGDVEVRGVCEDSRKVRAGDVFVARGGTKQEGARFVGEAVARGAVAVVVGMSEGGGGGGENPGSAILGLSPVVGVARVGNVNVALALLAHEVAGNPTRGMKMIGVTGTKGKTTVAYLMRSVLKAAGFTVGMVGTVEIDDGSRGGVVAAEMTTPGVVELVELFGRMKANGVTHCVMEVSSHALHQDRVAGIDFDVAMFTNLTGDHLDYHGTMEAYGAAKRRLFEGLKEGATAVVNVDDAWGERMVEGCKGRVVRVGLNDGAAATKGGAIQWMGEIQAMNSGVMEMTVGGMGCIEVLVTPLVGRHNAYNLLCVVAAASALGISPEASVAILAVERGAPGRLQRVEWGGNFQVFVDYAHTHDALENVLTALRAVMGDQSRDRQEATGVVARADGSLPDGRGSDGRLICVFGCGGDRDRTKRPKMGAVAERLADVVIVTSDNPRTENPDAIIQEVCAGFSDGWKDKRKITVEADRRAAIQRAIGAAKEGDVVLIAGKGHENYQIIGTTKHHFDDVEEAKLALDERLKIRKPK